MTLTENLSRYFGYDDFKEGQEKIIQAVLNGEDVLGIMPTGGGKSLCYQLPAMQMEGITLVISPLISLMKDQVDALTEMGISSTFLNSSLNDATYNQRLEGIQKNQYKLLYIAPERLNANSFLELSKQLNIAMVAVDEAHCISQWGHDFRPHYQEIPRFIESLPHRPVVAAYTATATVKVTQEIKELLKLRNPVESIIGFDRPNLFYQVVKTGDKFKYVTDSVKQNFQDKSGIIYCATRKTVEGLTEKLTTKGFSAAAYHGGMRPELRQKNQNDFIHDRVHIMVATNAFGMGINKPDVRFIIHYNMPQNMEAYYQEAGRGGRDGEVSHCTILYSPADIVKQKRLIQLNQTSPEREKLLFENLQYLVDYCHTNECLRKKILEYFGETPTFERCENCGNCLDESEMMDITIEAQKILSCIYRLKNRFGLNMIISVLRGSKNKKILDLKLDALSTYGIMTDHTSESLREIIMTLVAKDYIFVTADEYPVLKLTAAAGRVLKSDEKVFHKKHLVEMKAVKNKKQSKVKYPIDFDEILFDLLKALRYSISQEKEVPPFMIFHDATLKEMAAYFPLDQESFLKISGVGQAKFENYGDLFIKKIQVFVEANQIEIRERNENEIIPIQEKMVEKESRSDSYKKTYDIYKKGFSLEEIASERGVTRNTVIGHLMRCDQQDKQVDWSNFLDEKKEALILKAIEKTGLDLLKPIKEALPETCSYEDIKIVIHKNGLQ
ncbi:DNA helicase RecQ [Acetobacterium tundrae]|uniref:DNA helicase RecQ n=1 Tax=Acetobacterium tundrae TaxID=132932 RepID=A0ABR6WR90_9FIRM|nr:DNA helicase RecQ [Acetobacterium tundrae]MBC3798642.1 DNA helicase RecQ [Acetobacterium tundrae]